MSDRLACPHCTKSFADENARFSHAKAKHKGKRIAHLRPAREPSMADLVVEASLAKACGEPVDEWMNEMFGDYL